MRGGKPELIPSAEGNTPGGKAFPSYVAFTKDWKMLVGEPARRQVEMNTTGTAKKAKRKMGTGEKITICPKGQNDKREYLPEEISAEILKKVKRDAESFLGDTVDSAVITVPAYFNDNQRSATKVAGEVAGLKVLALINEPTAAAIAYGFNDKSKAQKILVFDMGGGTLDITIMDFLEGEFNVDSTSGDTQLGGTDMDVALSKFIIDEFNKNNGVDLSKDPTQKMRIEEACEKAKIELSMLEETTINIPFITPTLNLERTLKRSELESIVKDIVDKCNKPIDDALQSVGLTKEDIDSVILVGGPTRMPIIKNFVTKKLGDKVVGGTNPMECVCFGAAIFSEVLKGDGGSISDGAIVVNDVTPLPLGVELIGSRFSVIIPKNSTVPTYKEVKGYTTVQDNQTVIRFGVYQGEGELVTDKDFVKLGDLTITGIDPAPAGVPRVKVRFDINSDGMVETTATDESTGKTSMTKVQSKLRVSAEEIVNMQKAKQWQ